MDTSLMPSREMLEYVAGMTDQECRDALELLSGYRAETLAVLLRVCEGRRLALEARASSSARP